MNKVNSIILALGLMAALCGTASATQLYVNENGWWRDGGAFNTSSTPIQSAVNAADGGDSIFVYNGTYYEGGGVSITKDRITLQGEDANTTTIHGKWTAENVVQVTGDYINVSGFTVAGSAKSRFGIYVNADYCTISDNIASSNYHGIYLSSSSNNTFTGNNASNNYYGIYLSSSSNNKFTSNTANSNDHYGIFMWSSSSNNLTNNNANSNKYGIYLLFSSSSNTLTNNNCSNNFHDGIHLDHSSMDNIITENNISNNRCGIYLDWSGDNEIYHNNFIDNNKQAYDHHGFNEWDKGPIIGGNYWGEYVCHGNPSNGTEPYIGIDTNAGAVDNYPFEEPNGWVTVYPPTIIYVPDDYAKIQWAVDNASVGDTIFVWNGSYTENVNVYKRLTLEGEGADVVTVTAADSGDHVFEVTDVNYVNISGFAVRGATDGGAAGIRLDNVDYCNISGNNAYGNDNGIVLGGSSNNTLASNTANSNSMGIHLDNTDNSNITCNWVQNNTQRGFYLTGGSTGNNISCNNIIENGDYNATSGGWEWQFYIDQYNPVEAKHNYWGAGMSNATIDASIYDDEEGGWGEVEFYPFETGPVPCAPVPELPTVMLFAVGLIMLAGYARRR